MSSTQRPLFAEGDRPRRRAVVWLTLAAIVTLGGALRGGALVRTDGVGSDGARYLATAYNFEHGRWAVRESALGEGLRVDRLYPPLYPALIAALSPATRDPISAGQLISFVSGVATIALTYLLGRRFGPAVGLVAALLVAASWELISYSVQIMTESLFGALLVAALVWFGDGRSAGRAFGASCALALAFLAKPAGAAVGLVLAIHLGLRARAEGARALPALAALVVPLASTILVFGGLERSLVAACEIHSNSVLPFMHTLFLRGDPALPSWDAKDTFSVAGYVLEHPARYAWHFVRSYVAAAGEVVRLVPAPLLAAATLAVLVRRRAVGAGDVSSKRLLWATIVVLPLVPSVVIVHEKFMARMVLPLAALVYVLVAAEVVEGASRVSGVLRARLDVSALRSSHVVALALGVAVLGASEARRALRSIEGDPRGTVWREAGRFVQANVPSASVTIDDSASAEVLRGYVRRDLVFADPAALLRRAREPWPPGRPTEYALIFDEDCAAALEAIAAGQRGAVTLLARFGERPLAYHLFALGEP